MEIFFTILIMTLVVSLSGVVTRVMPFQIPLPLMQIAIGALLAWPTFGLHVEFDPELFLVLFIPPLLFADGWKTPTREFLEHGREIFGLALALVVVTVVGIGFLIYWVISIRSRTLQFGVLRAMGVTFKEIIATLGYEQLLVSVASIAAGFVVGGMASDIFVPLFRTMYDAANQVPPFIVRGDAGDYIKMYVIIAVMLAGGFAVLGGIIKRININKALKLGED